MGDGDIQRTGRVAQAHARVVAVPPRAVGRTGAVLSHGVHQLSVEAFHVRQEVADRVGSAQRRLHRGHLRQAALDDVGRRSRARRAERVEQREVPVGRREVAAEAHFTPPGTAQADGGAAVERQAGGCGSRLVIGRRDAPRARVDIQPHVEHEARGQPAAEVLHAPESEAADLVAAAAVEAVHRSAALAGVLDGRIDDAEHGQR